MLDLQTTQFVDFLKTKFLLTHNTLFNQRKPTHQLHKGCICQVAEPAGLRQLRVLMSVFRTRGVIQAPVGQLELYIIVG